MSWKDLAWLSVVILGMAFFLYGSNAYNALLGWAGVALVIVGIVGEIVQGMYGSLVEKKKVN